MKTAPFIKVFSLPDRHYVYSCGGAGAMETGDSDNADYGEDKGNGNGNGYGWSFPYGSADGVGKRKEYPTLSWSSLW